MISCIGILDETVSEKNDTKRHPHLKEEEKLSLLADNMILYRKIPEESTKKFES